MCHVQVQAVSFLPTNVHNRRSLLHFEINCLPIFNDLLYDYRRLQHVPYRAIARHLRDSSCLLYQDYHVVFNNMCINYRVVIASNERFDQYYR